MSDKHPTNADHDHPKLTPLAKRFLWADSPEAVERLILGLKVLCVVLVVLDLFVHRHQYAPGETLPGYYAVVGFVAFTLIVLGASQLRRLILRSEDYYAPHSVDAEEYPEEGTHKVSWNNVTDQDDAK